MQHSSGHSVITPASTPRADSKPRRLTSRERSNMAMPCPGNVGGAKILAMQEATKPQSRRGAESDQSALNQARTSSKAVSHD